MKVLAWKYWDGDIAIKIYVDENQEYREDEWHRLDALLERDDFGVGEHSGKLSNRGRKNKDDTYDYNELYCLVMYDYFKEHPNAGAILFERDTIEHIVIERVSEIDFDVLKLLAPKEDYRYSWTLEYSQKKRAEYEKRMKSNKKR